MIPVALAEIDEGALGSLIVNGVPEGLTLEYKQALPEENDEGLAVLTGLFHLLQQIFEDVTRTSR